ncbi:altered inheritance of mitochondria protein 24 [Pycnococcus provasolii]
MKFTSLSGVNRSASSSRPSYAYGHGKGAGGLRFRRGGGARGGGARGGGGHGGGPPRGVSGGRQSEWWDDPRNDPKYEKWYYVAIIAASGTALTTAVNLVESWRTDKNDTKEQYEQRKGKLEARSLEPPSEMGVRTNSPFTPSAETMRRFGIEVMGGDSQVAQLKLQPGESLLIEPGALLYRSPGVRLRTTLGEGGLVEAIGRLITGETFFINVVDVPRESEREAISTRPEVVGISAAGNARLVVLDLKALGGEVLAHRSAYLFSSNDVSITPAPPPNLAYLAGGSGIILQRLEASKGGIACVQGRGTIIQQTLAAGEIITVDPSSLLSLTPTCKYSLAFVGGPWEILFGGAGAWKARLEGPGSILMQSMGESRARRFGLM